MFELRLTYAINGKDISQPNGNHSSSFWQYDDNADIIGVPWKGGVKRQ